MEEKSKVKDNVMKEELKRAGKDNRVKNMWENNEEDGQRGRRRFSNEGECCKKGISRRK